MSQNQSLDPTEMPNNPSSSNLDLRMTVYTALFTALIIIGGYISIPIPVGPVPIVLADFFVMVTGLFLGFKWGLTSVALYLCLGILGLPVFSSGTSGLAILFGPTGGFLFGYLLLVASVGLISSYGKQTMVKNLIALVVGNILLFAIGIPWLKVVMNFGWTGAFVAGLTPFIPGIIIKIAVASALGRVLLPRFKQTRVSASVQ